MRRTALIVTISAVLAITGTAAAIVAGFPDVPDDHVHANGIQWASDNRLMRGYDNGNFGPEDPVTRGQLSTIFFRYDNTLDDAGTGVEPRDHRADRSTGPSGSPRNSRNTRHRRSGDGPGRNRCHPAADGLTIGGPIADNHTPTSRGRRCRWPPVTTDPGVRRFQIPGRRTSANATSSERESWSGLSSRSGETGGTDGEYDGGEGIISPNVLMPGCNERHANVSGEIVPSPNATTSVGLVAFGYTERRSRHRRKRVDPGGGGLIVQPLGSLAVGGDTFAFEGEGAPG